MTKQVCEWKTTNKVPLRGMDGAFIETDMEIHCPEKGFVIILDVVAPRDALAPFGARSGAEISIDLHQQRVSAGRRENGGDMGAN